VLYIQKLHSLSNNIHFRFVTHIQTFWKFINIISRSSKNMADMLVSSPNRHMAQMAVDNGRE
jgi:hypothetical protein